MENNQIISKQFLIELNKEGNELALDVSKWGEDIEDDRTEEGHSHKF